MQVTIVGAGIIGATLAYALSRQGAQVTVVDAQGVATGATGQSFGWINASFYADAAHFDLRARGIEAYRRLCHDLRLPVAWSGCLCWENQGAALEAQAAELRDLGYGAQVIDAAAFATREPHVSPPAQALFFEAEAAAEPAALAQAVLDASGARVITGCTVQEIVVQNGTACGVRIANTVMPADRVVVAGGTGSTALLAQAGVALPMLPRPGVIFQTQVLPPLLSHVCVAPIGEFRQTPEGRIVMPAAVSHQSDDSSCIAASPDVLADQAVARLGGVLKGIEPRWERVALAQRPVPQDGLPVVGACGPDGLFASVMHSGVTLAPVVAEILAAEITEAKVTGGEVTGGGPGNAQAALIAPYRPQRFVQD